MPGNIVVRELHWALIGLLCACGGGRTSLDMLPGREHPISADASIRHDSRPPHCEWSLSPPVMYPAMMSAECVSAGDMDGDGDLDLVVGNLNAGSVSVFLNRGDGTFAPQVTYKDFQPQSLTLADLDGDGRLDVVVSNGNGGSG